MNKPSFVISCPIDTYSGYGARSRDIVKALIELNKYEVKILPQRWGNTLLKRRAQDIRKSSIFLVGGCFQ